MESDSLLLETKGLSEEELMKIESANMPGFAGLNEINNENKKIRTAGKYRGKGWMADDFDETPECFKEYMK